MRYYCEAYDRSSVTRIGGFVVEAIDMPDALRKAARNIELVLRPRQFELRITELPAIPTVKGIPIP